MRVISFLDRLEIVDRILDHIHHKIDIFPLPLRPPPGFLGAARSHTRLAAAQTTILCTVSIARQVCSKGPASYEPGLNFRYFGNYLHA